MKRRIGKIEARAIAACEDIKRNGSMDFNMEWRKSACWNRVAVITYRGEKAGCASGCGYDKESACLCDFLHPLIEGGIGASGVGFASVASILAKHGWNLEHTYNGKHEDGYRISRMEAQKQAA